MLFVEGKTLRHTVNGPQRIILLEGLREKNLIPVIRSARLASFNALSLSLERIPELETSVALAIESETQEAYIRGDLFAFSDHIFFLLFDEDETPMVRAGIVYEPRTTEPFRKLDSFCLQVRELLEGIRDPQTSEEERAAELPQWEHGKPMMPAGFKRFVARQDSDSLFTSSRKESISERIRAASMLEDADARVFLRRAKEAHVEGYAGRLLAGDAAESYQDSINRLEDAGLVGREVQISCRRTGHALFRLPSAHALAVVTVSDATCSECGSPVADEKVEDVFAPTRLASSLLEDGSWLISRLHYLLREQGIPDSEIAVVPSDRDGYGQMMANICGEPFLLVARDGDLTPSFARWAIDLELETEASHLVVVATGRIHNQGGLLLRNHARQRAMGGRDFELVLTDDAVTAANELRNAFERVSQRVVAEQVCHLDSSLGLNVSQMIITKFNLSKKESFKDEEPFENENLPGESEPDFAAPMPPLALAAGASTSAADVVIPEVIMPEPAAENLDHEMFDGSIAHQEYPNNGQ